VCLHKNLNVSNTKLLLMLCVKLFISLTFLRCKWTRDHFAFKHLLFAFVVSVAEIYCILIPRSFNKLLYSQCSSAGLESLCTLRRSVAVPILEHRTKNWNQFKSYNTEPNTGISLSPITQNQTLINADHRTLNRTLERVSIL
jgi:hypothetical protein